MLLLLGLVHFYRQNNIGPKAQNVLLNAPNTSRLWQYGDIPVSYYKGVVAVEIPIYAIKVDGLNIPFSLSYHASEIKLQQEVSWVGFGGHLMRAVR